MQDENNNKMMLAPVNSAISLPVASMMDLATAGEILAQSNILGIRNKADGFIVAATCYQERMSPLKFTEQYHIIDGKPSLKSEAMLAKLLELGGEYEITSRTPERIEVTFSYKKAKFTSLLVWDEIKNESYVKSRNGQLKDNWSTPRRRMQMMWARAVSDGVRCVCPLATRGCYTPEEVMDFDDRRQDVPATITAQTSDSTDYTVCRAPGRFAGQRWSALPTEALSMALGANSPSILPGDRDVIASVIAERNQQQQDKGE